MSASLSRVAASGDSAARPPLEDARRLVEGYVGHYNNVRLNSATGYITPKDMLARGGSRRSICNQPLAERDRKLEAARKQRRSRRQQGA